MTKKTQSAGGVILNNNQVLVVSQHGKTWSLPKGHIENNETPLETAYREIYEETGVIQLELIQPLGHYTRYKIGKNNKTDDLSEEKTLHFFLFKTQQHIVESQDSDNPDVKWVSINAVTALLTHQKDKEFFNQIKPTLHAYSSNAIKIETTFPTQKEANTCTAALIKQKLAACCHIYPINSVYSWDNTIENSNEFVCVIKTQARLQNNIEALIKKTHTYDVPQFIVTPIHYLSSDYLNWFNAQFIKQTNK